VSWSAAADPPVFPNSLSSIPTATSSRSTAHYSHARALIPLLERPVYALAALDSFIQLPTFRFVKFADGIGELICENAYRQSLLTDWFVEASKRQQFATGA
jgi:hypothetical protein